MTIATMYYHIERCILSNNAEVSPQAFFLVRLLANMDAPPIGVKKMFDSASGVNDKAATARITSGSRGKSGGRL